MAYRKWSITPPYEFDMSNWSYNSPGVPELAERMRKYKMNGLHRVKLPYAFALSLDKGKNTSQFTKVLTDYLNHKQLSKYKADANRATHWQGVDFYVTDVRSINQFVARMRKVNLMLRDAESHINKVYYGIYNEKPPKRGKR